MDDNMPVTDASPSGIAECLGMLADEALSLQLVRTFMALRETLAICLAEASAAGPGPSASGESTEPAALSVH